MGKKKLNQSSNAWCVRAGSGDTFCEGDIGPDSGEEVTLEVLEVARDLANAFSGACSLVDQ